MGVTSGPASVILGERLGELGSEAHGSLPAETAGIPAESLPPHLGRAGFVHWWSAGPAGFKRGRAVAAAGWGVGRVAVHVAPGPQGEAHTRLCPATQEVTAELACAVCVCTCMHARICVCCAACAACCSVCVCGGGRTHRSTPRALEQGRATMTRRPLGSTAGG